MKRTLKTFTRLVTFSLVSVLYIISIACDVETKQVDLIPVKSIQLYKEDYYLGRELPVKSVMDASHIYNYVYDPNIYKHDLVVSQINSVV